MTKDHLFDHVPVPEANIFRIQGEIDPVAEAKRYSAILEQELTIKEGVPSFDILMLGMETMATLPRYFLMKWHCGIAKRIVLWHPSGEQSEAG